MNATDNILGRKSGVEKRRAAFPFLSVALGLLITLCWGNSVWIMAKAHLAQYLIAEAWQQTLTNGTNIKPWPWADTWPVARLEFPALKQGYYVLAGSHGTSLAFGPGHADGTALIPESGTMVINGHRDTHFKLLEQLATGDAIEIQIATGEWYRYKVAFTQVIDTRTNDWLISHDKNEIHLMTCYPFNSLDVNPPLRYVVVATPVLLNH